MAWICYLPFFNHRRKFTTETAIIFVFASVSSNLRSLIDSLCNMFYLQTFRSLVPFLSVTQVLNTGIAPARLVNFQR